jgi:hypothetical protein
VAKDLCLTPAFLGRDAFSIVSGSSRSSLRLPIMNWQRGILACPAPLALHDGDNDVSVATAPAEQIPANLVSVPSDLKHKATRC